MPGLKIQREENRDGIVYFELEGTLDAHNYETLEEFFDKHLDGKDYRFVVNLKRLEYVSSSGAGVFIGAVGTCQDHGGDIVFMQPAQGVREIFELLGVLQIFPLVDDFLHAEEYFEKKVT